ncbi:PAS domain-containing sensor histidine kinase [Oculatella sp. LEGE 06141]|uniref:sensor histidine kinase n=1 Tax=Oculatella sp. LEGE 06141 TaxID=1828648 RepID=UPI00187FB866|nr:PAS domain-containing sensor histidine kinase [Oculatella sp. LEGE 06141]MBE9180862.1 PAS domain-containing sensor histidine kinase [Oculatella sp. LEGE 06141]
MEALDFEREIQAVQGRLAVMRQCASTSSALPPDLTPLAIGELSTSLEELYTAAEELYVQHEELSEAYRVLELKWGQYQELFEFAPDAYLVTDAAGVIRNANQAASALLKIEPKFLSGKPLVLFVAASDRLLFSTRLSQLAHLALLDPWLLHLQCRNGEVAKVEATVSLVCDSDGQPTAFRWQLRHSPDRTQPPTGRNHSYTAEQELSDLKARFVRTMSHEFRTPLHVIQMASHLLERYGHNLSQEQQQQCLQKIPLAVRSLTRMLEKILAYGKTQASPPTVAPRCLNLYQFCRDLVEPYQANATGVERIHLDWVGNCEFVEFDPSLLQQILNNLLSNALNYSAAESIVYLRLTCEPEQLIVQIQDQGIGIPLDEQARLVLPFHRAHNAETIPGTGLGLTIAQHAVEVWGGTIAIESELNQGSTFTVWLPLHRPETEQ